MKTHLKRFFFAVLLLSGFALASLAMRPAPQTEDEALVARGAYLANVAGCIICHTPFQEQYMSPDATLDDLQTLSFFEKSALDMDRAMGGGRPFALGPAGVIFSGNLTPDEATGLGAWTDEEIKTAIRIGVHKEGRQMHPIMPFRIYNLMADEDLDAIVAYLRTLEPIENEVPVSTLQLPSFGFTMPEETITAPDSEDTEAYGEYLVRNVLPCQDCHTPLDPETGESMTDLYLAGGQPFEGPWGIIYSANITPHDETGIGDWSEEEMRRAIQTGIRPDGRRLVLMPWQDYAGLTEQDINAVLAFLRDGVEAVDNEVPAPSLNEGFEQYIE